MTVRGLAGGESAALLVNECQNAMVDPRHGGADGLAGEVARSGMLARIAALATTCRSLGLPVIHSTIVLAADRPAPAPVCLLLGALVKGGQVRAGQPGAQIAEELTPQAGDLVSERSQGLTPFHDTDLESLLRARGIQTLILTGVSTNIGIPGACLEAVNRGFTVVVPRDAVAGAWPEANTWQLQHTLPLLATVTTCEAVTAALLR